MSPGRRSQPFGPVLVCFVLSGIAGLVFQTAWSQQFSLVFGTSELAVATVLAAYMTGLMAGAAVAARVVERVRRPLALYGFLEVGIGVSALLVPVWLGLAGRLQLAFFGGGDLPPDAGALGSGVFYACTALVVLLPPTAMMGATLPLLARFAVENDAQIGPRIGWLYTANTLGAASGALFTAFVALPWLGLTGTVVFGAALNAAVFVIAIVMLGGGHRLAPLSTEADRGEAGGRWILAMVLVSGFVSFSYEVTWTRLLSHFMGGSIYAFGAMLAVFLSGIGVGSAGAGRLARSGGIARAGFSLAQIGVAVSTAVAFAAVDRLPGLLSRAADGEGTLPGGAALSALVLLPGALFIGATFPFAVRILAEGAGQVGRASGRVFAWNTFGAIAGALVTGFVLLPELGIAGTVAMGIGANLVLAAGAAVAQRPRFPWFAGAAAVGLVLLFLLPPATPWRVLRTSPLSGAVADGGVRFFGVGRSASVLLIDQLWCWRLSTNGLPEAAIQPRGGRPDRFGISRWLGLVPIAERPETRSMLVVGLGAGLTLEAIPSQVSEIHVVELEPEVIRANRAVAGQRRRDILADPRVQVFVNDARSGLMLSSRRYDAIVSQPSHPWTAGASHLYTREFFTLVRDRLNPDGVFTQWIGKQFIDDELLRSLIATMAEVFESVEVFEPYPHGSLLFVGSRTPMDVAATADRGFDAARDEWRSTGVFNPHDIVMTRLLNDRGARRVASGAPVIRDGRNLLMTGSPRVMHRRTATVDALRVVPADLDAAALWLATGDAGIEAFRRLLLERSFGRAERMVERIHDASERRVAQALLFAVSGRKAEAVADLVAMIEADHTNRLAVHGLVHLERERLLTGAGSDAMNTALDWDPDAAAVLEGWRLIQIGRPQAVRTLEPVLAAVGPDHLLWPAATNLRVTWRAASGNADAANEALELLDQVLIHQRRPIQGLLQRVRLAHRAGRADAALASLAEIVGGARTALPDPVLATLERLVSDLGDVGDEINRDLKARIEERLTEYRSSALDVSRVENDGFELQ